ncbi:MAG: hypothetical protein U1F43_18320 [Myxococcota bacterium]
MALALGACASERHVIELEPMQLEAMDSAHGHQVEVIDPEALFSDANNAFSAQDFAAAARQFGLVVDRFPEHRYVAVSAYNAGLALLRMGQPDEALGRFRRALALTEGSKDGQDALFQIAACHELQQQWAAMREDADAILKPHYASMGMPDRIAALATRGRAEEGLGMLAFAERDYRKALELYQANLEMKGLDKSPAVSLAQFRIGEIYFQLFASIRFKLPTSRMARDLEDKSNFFLMAQNAYLRTLRLAHADWAVIAGFRLGALYEGMYDDMLAAEIPAELTHEEVELYYDELKGKIRPLLVRAIDIYERNLRLGQRFGKNDDWMKKTEASLARLKDVLRAEASRDAEAQLRPVVEQ